MTGKRLYLPDVTLVTVDLSCHELTAMAIDESCRHAEFGDVRVFTNVHGMPYGEFVPGLDTSSLLEFSLYTLPYRIKTEMILWVHFDSWIIDPGMWRDQFLTYDYIGAPWWYTDGRNVGNSGFHLRSKRLMLHIAENRAKFPMDIGNEDDVLCRVHRPRLPQFKWAPESVAQDFSFERTRPSIDSRHFGFHGLFNWPFVLPPDRLAERMALVRQNRYIRTTNMIQEIDSIHTAHWLKIRSGVHVGRETEIVSDVA